MFTNCQRTYGQETLKTKPRQFVAASSNNFPPMNTLDTDGHLTGFGRELSEAVIEAIGGDVTHIHSSRWVEVLEWLNAGKADFIHDTGYMKERDEFLDYTTPILEMPEVIFVRTEQYDITGFDALQGKSVACVQQHITHLYLQKFPEITCFVVGTPLHGLYELIAGNVDALIYPKQIILYHIQQLRLNDKIKIIGDPLRNLAWSMVVKEGNMDMLDLLNEGIAKIRKSGEYDRIYQKWWGKKILAGYSTRELQMFTIVITGISIAIVLSLTLLFWNWSLRKTKNALEEEIIERRQAEEALQFSRAQYRNYINNAPDGVFVVNQNGHYLEVNAAASQMTGYSEKELLCMHIPDLLSTESLEGGQQHFKQVVTTGRASGEFAFIPKDGTKRFWSVDAVKLAEDRFLGFGKDVTDRKIAEEALRIERKRLFSVLETIPAFVYLQTQDYTVIFANGEFRRLFGEPEGKRCHQLLRLCEHPCTSCPTFYVFKTSQPQIWEWQAASGRIYMIYDYPFFDTDGSPLVLEMGLDITEQKQAEQEVHTLNAALEDRVKQRTAELEAANKELKDFAYVVSHDLKAPLRGIGKLAYWLAEDFADVLDDNGREMADLLVGRVKRMDNLINGILQYSRIGRIIGKHEHVDIRTLLSAVIDMLDPPSTIHIHIDGELPIVVGDKIRLTQVFQNILENAMKFMDKPEGDIRVACQDKRSYWEFSITDNGPGIDPKYHEKIFQIFQTLHPRDEYESTGIGLALVKKFIEFYGGKIWIESCIGAGSTFSFTYPKPSQASR